MIAIQENLSKPLFAAFRKVELPIEERIYDSNGFLLRAACVCVKDSSENEVNYTFFQILKNHEKKIRQTLLTFKLRSA